MGISKKLNVGADFTAQFVGNGKLNPSAEHAIKEKIERERILEAERKEKEEKAARKAEKKKAKEDAVKKAEEEKMAALAEQQAKEAKQNKPKKEKLDPGVKNA